MIECKKCGWVAEKEENLPVKLPHVDDYKPTNCNDLKVALVGPFLPGKINYMGLEIIKNTVKDLPKVEFVFIGKTDQFFRDQLK